MAVDKEQASLALRPREAAAALGISTRVLWQLTSDGRVPCVRVGYGKRRMSLYPVQALTEWLARESGAGGKGGERPTPRQRVLDALANRGGEPEATGDTWAARCPAHNDDARSLTITERPDGRIKGCCEAGCNWLEILAAIGLDATATIRTSDQLFSTETPNSPRKGEYR